MAAASQSRLDSESIHIFLLTQINVALDGSPISTRDIGSQEIYAATIRWP